VAHPFRGSKYRKNSGRGKIFNFGGSGYGWAGRAVFFPWLSSNLFP
jgi:hypothetical protein